MNKHELADQLRNRQLSIPDNVQKKRLHLDDKGLQFFKNTVRTLPDNDIIESYIKCAHCGEMFIENERMLDYLISNSSDAEDFLGKTERYTEHKKHYESKK